MDRNESREHNQELKKIIQTRGDERGQTDREWREYRDVNTLLRGKTLQVRRIRADRKSFQNETGNKAIGVRGRESLRGLVHDRYCQTQWNDKMTLLTSDLLLER